ncbi:DUF2752 domain-containing protein [Allomuricauda sp. SCSIO 65647]|uniref:DUF2752 domain-containing protein n=1 Tax=Allomuricauda sp. SCSIO 65647 TaxID=2908843 RepID=UPI00391AB2C8
MSNKHIYIFAFVVLLLVVLVYYVLSPEKYDPFFPKCPVHMGLGIYCTGCGSQRALHDLFHLRIADAFSHNFLLIPSLLLIVFHWVVKVWYPEKKTFLQNRKAPLIILGVFILFTILRNIDRPPFNYLAP